MNKMREEIKKAMDDAVKPIIERAKYLVKVFNMDMSDEFKEENNK